MLSILRDRANIAATAYYIVKKVGLHITPQATRLYQATYLRRLLPNATNIKAISCFPIFPSSIALNNSPIMKLTPWIKRCIYWGEGHMPCGGQRTTHLWSWGSPFSFVGPRDWTQAPGSKHLYPLSHLLAYPKYFLEVFNSYHLHYSAHLPATTSHLVDGDRHLAGHPTLTFVHLAHFSQDNQKDHLTGRIYFLSTDLIPPNTT